MKLHDLQPPSGAHKPPRRIGRGHGSGRGKTAGRGTKGQKSRAGASIPAWFEGGQTPLHIRIPKLRGFRNINDIQYEVVNVGAISAAIETGKLEVQKGAPVTVNADTLKQAGLVRRDRLPLKILGMGEVTTTLFVLADAFTKSAREKIEAAGGTAQVIEIPSEPLAALGVEAPAEAPAAKPAKAPKAPKASKAEPDEEAPVAAEVAPEAEEAPAADVAEASADEADAPADNG